LAGVLVGAALVIGPGAAGAVEGGLYPVGAGPWAATPQFSATRLAGGQFQIQAPALNPAAAGNQWEMNWGCPVAGSEIHAVQFGALRTQAPSSLALVVTGNRQTLWSEGDATIPQSPELGRAYDIRLPGGQCNVHLALAQVEVRAQHARGYFIDNPRVLVRDLTPPAVSLRAITPGWINAVAGAVRVQWTTSDNFGGDGVAAQRVLIAGQARWTGAPGVGNHEVTLALDGIGDGVHGVEVRADGDGTGAGSAAGTIQLDRTAPTVSGLSASSPGAPGAVALAWRVADNLSGVGLSQAEVNAAGDGSVSGAWIEAGRAIGTGSHSLTATPALADGVHAWRIRASDAAGNAVIVPGPERVVVDTTPPKLELHAAPTKWVNRVEVDLTATDNLQTALGLAPIEFDLNTAADAGEGGQWLRALTSPGSAGRRIVTVAPSGLADGRHLMRVVARNGAPFAARLLAERRVVVRVDLTAPVIASSTFSSTDSGQLSIAWIADDPLAGVAKASVQWRSGSSWRTIASEDAPDGPGAMLVDVSALPGGAQPLRLAIADAAGNVGIRSKTVRLTGNGSGTTAADPLTRFRDAHLALAVERARVLRAGGRTTLVRRISSGGAVIVSGRLLDRRGRAIVGAEIQARGHRGRLMGRALTRRDGRFRLRARPQAGGLLRVGVPVGRRLFPVRPSADVRLEVRPDVSLSASSTVATSGTEVLFTGRLRPAPGDIGLGSRKGIVLEWLDPVRISWRPVVNARIRRDGTFSVPWRFGIRGLTIPMRVAVPEEVGWPLLPARSRVIRVTLG
jgi:hypothetical protein